MDIVVGFTAAPEAQAAAHAAIDEAALRGAGVVLLAEAEAASAAADPEVAAHAAELSVQLGVTVLEPEADLGDALVDASYGEETAMIVIGLRRRSPVGKLFLGSTSQRVLLEAGCPVHAVKVRVGPRR